MATQTILPISSHRARASDGWAAPDLSIKLTLHLLPRPPSSPPSLIFVLHLPCPQNRHEKARTGTKPSVSKKERTKNRPTAASAAAGDEAEVDTSCSGKLHRGGRRSRGIATELLLEERRERTYALMLAHLFGLRGKKDLEAGGSVQSVSRSFDGRAEVWDRLLTAFLPLQSTERGLLGRDRQCLVAHGQASAFLFQNLA